jgi:ATP dependent DNA ligase C terminal region
VRRRSGIRIGGFTEPAGSRVGFGALLLGYYQDGHLRYAGKVAAGFDRATLLDLRRRLEALRQPVSPFGGEVRERGARWVRPELVAQIGFSEWTRDGMLRHPRFPGLSFDKIPPRWCVRCLREGRDEPGGHLTIPETTYLPPFPISGCLRISPQHGNVGRRTGSCR